MSTTFWNSSATNIIQHIRMKWIKQNSEISLYFWTNTEKSESVIHEKTAGMELKSTPTAIQILYINWCLVLFFFF